MTVCYLKHVANCTNYKLFPAKTVRLNLYIVYSLESNRECCCYTPFTNQATYCSNHQQAHTVPYIPEHKSHSIISCIPQFQLSSFCFKSFMKIFEEIPDRDSLCIIIVHTVAHNYDSRFFKNLERSLHISITI